MVEKIEEFESKLDFGALGNGSVLGYRCVEIDQIRAEEDVFAKVWLLIERRQLKCAEGRPGKSFVRSGRLRSATNDGGPGGQSCVIAIAIAENVVWVASLQGSDA